MVGGKRRRLHRELHYVTKFDVAATLRRRRGVARASRHKNLGRLNRPIRGKTEIYT